MSKKTKGSRQPHGRAINPMEGHVKKKPADFFPDPTFSDGRPRCTAWARSAGRQCRLSPKPPTSKCRFHGGAGSGPPPIHGRYTKLAQVRERIERNLTDPGQLELRAEIGILGYMLDGLAGQIVSEEPLPFSAELLKLSKAALAAVRYGDQGRATNAMQKLVEMLEKAQDQRATRDEFRSTAGDLKSLITAQVNQDLLRQSMVPVHVVWEYIEWNQAIMFEFLDDSEQRSAYMRKLEALIRRPPPRGQLIDGEFVARGD